MKNTFGSAARRCAGANLKTLIYIVLSANALLFAQTQDTVKTCPNSFYAAGGTYSPGTSPKFGGLYAVATPATKCGAAFQVYSFTLTAITPVAAGGFSTSATTGAALPLRQLSTNVSLYGFTTLGATATAAGTKLTVPYGLVLPISIGDWVIMPAASSAGGKTSVWLGIGKSW